MKRTLCLLFAALFLFSCSAEPPVEPTPEPVETIEPEEAEIVPETEKPEEAEPAVNEDGYLTKSGVRVDAETVESYPQLTNLPTLYLHFRSRRGLDAVRHGVYTDATYTLIDGGHTNSYYELPLEIKGRGNYSWSFAQKPYSLKLGEKADFLGMGEAKKWVLVTVHSDKTMLHNYLTQECAEWLGLPGTCDNEYVDLVVNGEYAGTYVLTEKIELKKNRIEVAESKGVLFEIEMVYRHTCDLCISMYDDPNPSNSIHLRFKTCKGKDVEDLTKEEREEALREYGPFFDSLEIAMKRGTMEEVEQYIDVDSFVNWYLLNELTRNYDSMFVTSCYCFIGDNGKLYMGPCWDYDTCYGAQYSESEGAWVRQAPWYNWLFLNQEGFVQAVRERWTEIRQEGNDIVEWFDTNIDATVERISASEQLEHELFPDSEFVNVEYSAAVTYMKRWLAARFAWMDEEFLIS